jgi:quercetin dioxygenase-like cupin family protein
VSWKLRFAVALAMLLGARIQDATAQMPVHTDLRPRVVHRGEGERRYLADGRFMLLKVGPVTTGANYLFMGFEDLPPGTAIPAHQHEVDEEILIVHRGRLRVTFDRDSADAVAGDAVFLPPRTRVSVRTLGPDTASIFFVFPRAAVERCFQFVGRAQGQTAPPAYSRADTAEALRACQMTYF